MISSRIHRYWTGPHDLPCVSGLGAQYAAGFGRIRDWTDDTLPAHIKTAIDDVTKYVPAEQRLRHRGNVARLLLLREFGGLWLDHDVILLSLPSATAPWTAWAGTRMSSSVMCFEANDPLLTVALRAIEPADTSVESSGELMLSRVWASAAVPFHRLPCDRDGVLDRMARPWAVHTWHTG